jgi:hypothetical protein
MVYYKIYTGVKQHAHFYGKSLLYYYWLKAQKVIKNGFIRYNDPDSHLRLRFLVTKQNNSYHYQFHPVFWEVIGQPFSLESTNGYL